MGSGHILVYAFDVLMQIYTAAGWSERDSVKSILLNNLWGLDIDDRAGQLAYFAVMMKAQQYDHRWLSRQARNPIQLNVFSLQNSGDWLAFEQQMRRAFKNHPSLYEDAAIRTAEKLFADFADAKEFGSIIQPKVTLEDLDMLGNVLDDMMRQSDLMDLVGQADATTLVETLRPMILQCRALVQKYHVVVTNPPYMGSSGMCDKLASYIRNNYVDSKSDLFSVFIERAFALLNDIGYESMITMESWMFLSSFEQLRRKVISNNTICSLIHMPYLGKGGTSLGINFGTDMAVIRKSIVCNYLATYDRISYYETDDNGIPFEFPTINKYYAFARQNSFLNIPGAPIAYWASPMSIDLFDGLRLKEVINPKQGTSTGDDETYVRYWFEIDNKLFSAEQTSLQSALASPFSYFPLDKGGEYRRWYGNNEKVIRLDRFAYEKLLLIGNHLPSRDLYFREGITWSKITSSRCSFRLDPPGYVFSSVGMKGFPSKKNTYYVLGFLNSVLSDYYLEILSPGMSTVSGDLEKLPIVFDEEHKELVDTLVQEAINHSIKDWDSFETSWGFSHHPLVTDRREYEDQMTLNRNMQTRQEYVTLISKRYEIWERECDERFTKLKTNEEELNRVFIDIYGLQDELTPDVDDKYVTVRKADFGRDIRSLISYAVGCMLGRYSLDKPGLAFAGGNWDASQYTSYLPDHDGILPITDDEYFDDDIVGMFVNWVRTVYGEETLEANLKFIADALGGKGTPREVIRNYFLNDFYADHLKVYQKRPIYWLFSSGKKNGFKCLIYMHRYQPDLLARIRTDYVHEQQERYRTQLTMLEDSLQTASASERVKLNKRIAKLKDQALELQQYEEKIHHLADQMIPIDLDDGVKVNYAKFQDVLEKIK